MRGVPAAGLRGRIERVFETIERAAGRAGRQADEITIVAVTKTVAAGRVVEAIAAGLSEFGENRVQEAREKIQAVEAAVVSDPSGPSDRTRPQARWHLIGHLQSNKAKAAAGLFSMIHSVDSTGLARRLDRAAAGRTGGPLDVLLQVNVSGEGSKSGLSPGSVRETLEEISSMDNLRARGLMTIPPLDPDPERARPYFAALRALAAQADGWNLPRVEMEHLSMGMTDDYPVAIQEGATMVRIGRALFGERETGNE